MKKCKDVTPLDFAINLDKICMIVERDKQPGRRGYVSLKLSRGDYFSTSGGLRVKNEEIIYQHRSLVFSSAINRVSEFYGDKRTMTWRPIEFPEEEVFTKWVLRGGSIGVYSFPVAKEVFGGMFNNGKEISIDVLGSSYALFGVHSRGVIGALVKADKRLKDVLKS